MLVEIKVKKRGSVFDWKWLKVQAFTWLKTYVKGIDGRRRLVWVYYTGKQVEGLVFTRLKITIEEDPCKVGGKPITGRLFRWKVYLYHAPGYAVARGECISLPGAMKVAEALAGIMWTSDPYDESTLIPQPRKKK